MLDDETKNALANYVLDQQDPGRLDLAVKLHDAFDVITERVIKHFVRQIPQFLEAELPETQGWSLAVDDLLENPKRRFAGLGVRRAWDNGLYVRIEAQNAGPYNWIIGVCSDKSYQNAELRKRLDDLFGNGRKSDTWPWFHYFADNAEFGHWEFGNWTSGAAVVAMRDGTTGDYGKRLCERIITIAKAVDSVFAAQKLEEFIPVAPLNITHDNVLDHAKDA